MQPLEGVHFKWGSVNAKMHWQQRGNQLDYPDQVKLVGNCVPASGFRQQFLHKFHCLILEYFPESGHSVFVQAEQQSLNQQFVGQIRKSFGSLLLEELIGNGFKIDS